MGKGSSRRPAQVPTKEWEKRWDETFGRPIKVTRPPDLKLATGVLEHRLLTKAEAIEIYGEPEPNP